jgi:hypothetical protein
MATDHEFGSLSTDLKLSLVEDYLKAFTQALHAKFTELWYIDAFAGTGERTVRIAGADATDLAPAVEERIERRRGSARIALDVTPPFSRYIFMDKMKRHCAALRELAGAYPGRSIDIVRGDANEAIKAELASQRWVGEPPSISKDNPQPIEDGMILHLEPKLEIKGAVFQFEEVIYVRKGEPEFLSELSPDRLPVIN